MSDLAPPDLQPGNVFHGNLNAGEGGTVNAVAGNQYYYVELSARALRRRIRYASDPARLDRELRLVVPPPGLDRDLAALRGTRLLVLAGGARTGLSTAARQRWRAFTAAGTGHRSEELFASSERELLDELGDLNDPSALLLDISHDRHFAAALTEHTAQVQTVLHERDSYLVVAVGEAAFPAFERVLPRSAHRVGRPDATAVIAERIQRPDLLERALADHDFVCRTADLWPPQAVQVAELLDDSPPEAALDKLVTMITSRLSSWTEELRPLLEDRLVTGHSRALLLAASALEGTGRDTIAYAARTLAQIAGEEPANASVLADQSLRQHFESLESEMVADGDTFRRLGYGEAVLPFAWKQFPTWRDPIQAWLDTLLGRQHLEDDKLAVLLPRLLTFAAATGAAELVTVRAATIAGEGEGTRPRRELAADLLLAGALDPTIGQQVRRQMWTWSYHRSGLSIALQRTVAQVCGDPEYTTRFPRNALTRLKHLIHSGIPSVNAAAVAAIVSTGRHLPPPTLIGYLSEWADDPSDPDLRATSPALLIALLGDNTVRDRWKGSGVVRDPAGPAARLWRAVLEHAAPGMVREAVAAWLAFAATAEPEHQETLADLLIDAASEGFWTLGQLSQALSDRAWSDRPADPDLLALRDRLAAGLSQAKVPLQ